MGQLPPGVVVEAGVMTVSILDRAHGSIVEVGILRDQLRGQGIIATAKNAVDLGGVGVILPPLHDFGSPDVPRNGVAEAPDVVVGECHFDAGRAAGLAQPPEAVLFEGRKRVAPFQGSEPAGPGGWFDKLPHREGEGREGEARTGIVKIGLGPLPFVSGNTRNPLGCKPCKATALAGEEDLGGIVIRGKPIHGGFEKIGILEKKTTLLSYSTKRSERGRCKVVVVVVVEAFAKRVRRSYRIHRGGGWRPGCARFRNLAHASRCRPTDRNRRRVSTKWVAGSVFVPSTRGRRVSTTRPSQSEVVSCHRGASVSVLRWVCAPYAALRINGVVEIACHRSFTRHGAQGAIQIVGLDPMDFIISLEISGRGHVLGAPHAAVKPVHLFIAPARLEAAATGRYFPREPTRAIKLEAVDELRGLVEIIGIGRAGDDTGHRRP